MATSPQHAASMEGRHSEGTSALYMTLGVSQSSPKIQWFCSDFVWSESIWVNQCELRWWLNMTWIQLFDADGQRERQMYIYILYIMLTDADSIYYNSTCIYIYIHDICIIWYIYNIFHQVWYDVYKDWDTIFSLMEIPPGRVEPPPTANWHCRNPMPEPLEKNISAC